MNISKPFMETTTQIQNEIAKMTTKAEMLTYLAMVKDYIGSTMKVTRALMKGMQ